MIFDPILILVTGFLSELPTLTISLDFSFLNVVYNVLRMVCYLIPVSAFLPLIGLSISVTIFKIICNFIRMIWSLLPIA